MGKKTQGAAGFFAGFGEGLSQIADRRYADEKAEADQFRQQSIMTFGQGLRTKAEQAAYERGRKDKLTDVESSREYSEGLLGEEREYKSEVADEALERSKGLATFKHGLDMKLQEARAKVAAAKSGGKYDNPLADDARNMINQKLKRKAINMIKGEEGASMDQFMFANSVTGEQEIDMAQLGAKYPEIAQEQEAMQILVEAELAEGNVSPAVAVARAEADYKKLTEEGESSSNATVEKELGLKPGTIKKLEAAPVNDQTVSSIYDQYTKDPQANKAQLAILQERNPELFKAVMAKVAVSSEDTERQKKIDKIRTEPQAWEGLLD